MNGITYSHWNNNVSRYNIAFMIALCFHEELEIVLNENKLKKSITILIFTLKCPKYSCVENNQSHVLYDSQL